MRKIAVTGATGHFGQATIAQLIQNGIHPSKITGLVRNQTKALNLKELGIELKEGDYDHFDSLVDAFQDVEKLLLISGTDLQNRLTQHLNVIRAAKEAGVQHVYYTSFDRKTENPDSSLAFLASSHIQTEQALKESGMKYTIFRNNLYLSVLPMFLGEQVLENGIFFPAGNGKAAFADRADLAEAVANVMAESGHENQEYVMGNSENYDFEQIATKLSQLSGKQITYVSPDSNTYSEVLTDAGVPGPYIAMFVGFAEAIQSGEFETANSDLEKLLGRKPLTLDAYLDQTYSS